MLHDYKDYLAYNPNFEMYSIDYRTVIDRGIEKTFKGNIFCLCNLRYKLKTTKNSVFIGKDICFNKQVKVSKMSSNNKTSFHANNKEIFKIVHYKNSCSNKQFFYLIYDLKCNYKDSIEFIIKCFKEFGVKTVRSEYFYSISGKLEIFSQRYHFSLSHSNELIVAAISNENIGVDVEYIKPIKMNFLNKVFSFDELNHLEKSQYNLLAFYNLWTRKESKVKLLENGISSKIKSVNVLINDNFCSFIIGNYFMNVCTSLKL